MGGLLCPGSAQQRPELHALRLAAGAAPIPHQYVGVVLLPRSATVL